MTVYHDIYSAVYNQDEKQLDVLLAKVDYISDIHWTIGLAAGKTNVQCAKRIALFLDPRLKTSALLEAAGKGEFDTLQYWCTQIDPQEDHSPALMKAAEGGKAQHVAYLIPLSDPTSSDSMALRWAVEQNHWDCVKLLYPVSDPNIALAGLEDDYGVHHDYVLAFRHFHEARQAEILHGNITLSLDSQHAPNTNKRKM